MAELIIRSAIGGTKLKSPKDAQILCRTTKPSARRVADRARRPDSRRIRVWDGPIRSCEKLLKNLQRRNELRDRYGVIGVEREAAGTMNRIPVGVIRGACDHRDKHKNKYAAAMQASYAKAVLDEIPPNDSGGQIHRSRERLAKPRNRIVSIALGYYSISLARMSRLLIAK
ncbi:hypothetical protein BKA67DRAFT_585762 [Truncatella angustata]|uniref:Uncharacterized protein n=1 Tax=Truncatella angustata TaxID=152316 RepID=A0A9P8UB67_9PEZI|nr:uncharacterized protein BKA67DRAFT_585762 [Truncatella angustata]KAH6645602.1 hypothetical protein BKA67DRAFT_585762 [Truncatella angustata]